MFTNQTIPATTGGSRLARRSFPRSHFNDGCWIYRLFSTVPREVHRWRRKGTGFISSGFRGDKPKDVACNIVGHINGAILSPPPIYCA